MALNRALFLLDIGAHVDRMQCHLTVGVEDESCKVSVLLQSCFPQSPHRSLADFVASKSRFRCDHIQKLARARGT